MSRYLVHFDLHYLKGQFTDFPLENISSVALELLFGLNNDVKRVYLSWGWKTANLQQKACIKSWGVEMRNCMDTMLQYGKCNIH